MDQILYQSQNQSALSVLDLLVGLGLSLLLGLCLSLVYRFTHKGATFEKTFLITLTLIAPVIALIIMFIGSNLTLSLGMVGALSIVRFRTAIKDSRDMMYLFLSIAMGLGSGTFNWKTTVAAAIFFFVVMILLRWSKLETPLNDSFILTLTADPAADPSAIRKGIEAHATALDVRGMDALADRLELVFEVRSFSAETSPEKLLDVARKLPHVRTVSLLSPQIRLPI